MSRVKKWIAWTLEAIGRCGVLYVADPIEQPGAFAFGWSVPDRSER